MQRGFFSRTTHAKLRHSIMEALDWLGWRTKVKSDSTVFVKPNFTWPKFRPGVVTSPQFLAELLPILKNRARRVMIGESDLSVFQTSRAYQGLGIDRICRDSGAEMVELSRMPSSTMETRVGRSKIRILLPRLLFDEVDVLVNAAVPKCHVVTGMSGAMKNLYGLIPDPFRGNKHRHEINRAIVGVNKLVPSDLVVMDGLYSLAGRGPILGEPISTNVIIGADNAIAADSIVCQFFEMDPTKIGHLKLAVREKLGSTDPSSIEMQHHLDFHIRLRARRSLMDYFAVLTFKSKIINKSVMSSPITPLLYKALKPLRSSKEEGRYHDDIGGLPQSQYKRSESQT
jgi:uncharacterized protein (DUF362 family)